MTDHTVTLTQVERARSTANQRPRDAATMMILDRSGARPKVLMGKRHHLTVERLPDSEAPTK